MCTCHQEFPYSFWTGRSSIPFQTFDRQPTGCVAWTPLHLSSRVSSKSREFSVRLPIIDTFYVRDEICYLASLDTIKGFDSPEGLLSSMDEWSGCRIAWTCREHCSCQSCRQYLRGPPSCDRWIVRGFAVEFRVSEIKDFWSWKQKVTSFIVGLRFSARFTFRIFTRGLIVIPWRKTVK